MDVASSLYSFFKYLLTFLTQRRQKTLSSCERKMLDLIPEGNMNKFITDKLNIKKATATRYVLRLACPTAFYVQLATNRRALIFHAHRQHPADRFPAVILFCAVLIRVTS